MAESAPEGGAFRESADEVPPSDQFQPGSSPPSDTPEPAIILPVPPAAPPAAAPRYYPNRSEAVTVLVLGILSIVFSGWCMGFLGIIAWVMGNRELREIDAGLRPPDNRGLAVAGRVCGIIGTCLFALFGVGVVLWLMVWLFMGTMLFFGR